MNRTFFYCLLFILSLPMAAFAESTISATQMLGSWESKQPSRKLQFFIDNTFIIHFQEHAPVRGNWVLYKNKNPFLFVLDNNTRHACLFVSHDKSILKIDGHKALAGSWEKTDNTIKMNW